MNFQIKDIDGNELDWSRFSNKVVMIVNVASNCGYTKLYTQLQKWYETYKDTGFEIIGVPCNQFKEQEPGTHAEIKEFCSTKYNVNFTLTEKVDVKGSNQHPLFKWLVETNPINNNIDEVMLWNFMRFLVDRDGKVSYWFSLFGPTGYPSPGPTEQEIEDKIKELLR